MSKLLWAVLQQPGAEYGRILRINEPRNHPLARIESTAVSARF